MKDFFHYQGSPMIAGSRDASREAIQEGLIEHGDDWMEMIQSRNKTAHTYNLDVANEIAEKILGTYFKRFEEFLHKMSSLD